MTKNQEINRIETLVEQIFNKKQPYDVSGVVHGADAMLIAELARVFKGRIVVVVPALKDAEKMSENLSFFMPRGQEPLLFPAHNIWPLKYMAYNTEIASRRIQMLYNMSAGGAPLVVTTVDALLQKILPQAEFASYPQEIAVNKDYDLRELAMKLIDGGYQRSAIVEESGDFSMRGGIMDVFCPLYDDPVRVEFFGDTVESIRFFSASTQRKLKDLDCITLIPAKETVVDRGGLAHVVNEIRIRAAELKITPTTICEITDALENEDGRVGLETTAPLFYSHMEGLWDHAGANTLFVMADTAELSIGAKQAAAMIQKNYSDAVAARNFCLPPEYSYFSWNEALENISTRSRLLNLRPLQFTASEVNSAMEFKTQTNAALAAELKAKSAEMGFKPLVAWIKEQQEVQRRVVLSCSTESQAKRLSLLLEPYNLKVRDYPEGAILSNLRPGVYIASNRLSSGFVWPDFDLAVAVSGEILGSSWDSSLVKRRKSKAAQLLNLEQLKQGDYIVHQDHGIGRYEGISRLSVEGVTNDFLTLIYRDDDRLYLPADRMSLISKYVGGDDAQPILDKMGGKNWEKVKSQVRKAAEKIAGELLELYAQRKIEPGYPFKIYDTHYEEFEAAFPYEETPDQLTAINEVLEDMQKPLPMDRLVCGDVGYGKTEVAMRAAFIGVSNGKQVAVLCPTTVLAEQHYQSFKTRFERHPVNVAGISRFRNRKEQKQILENLVSGKLDIIIGTHRLLQKDVQFKDLGLLILDEEQRFGVKHKAKIKQMRANVDVLTLTATPIPRTLHMSLSGLRDISLITTPPEYRKAIMTYLTEFDAQVIASAIRQELARKGQVYFVHNHVQTIENIAAQIRKMVPEARVSVGHGQMAEGQLEKVMEAFTMHEMDVLVCSSIIESGLDIPAANTIIVNRADCFGLAQMYQLRGRVGRSTEQAHAYLIVPHESLLSRDASKRLKVLMEYTDLGAGFQIAMNDLRIRGGGSMLGAEQSGHIQSVGYEMFLQLMEESVARLKGEKYETLLDPEINFTLSAFLSEEYIADIDQRLMLYRRLSKAENLVEINDIKAEMTDRYGELPKEAGNLLLKIMLKVLARLCGIKKLDLKDSRAVLYFSADHQKHPEKLAELVLKSPKKFLPTPDNGMVVNLGGPLSINKQLLALKNVLNEIVECVNF